MKILVIGSGGREHALVRALQSFDDEVLCAPGNAGIAAHARCVPIEATDIGRLLGFAHGEEIDLTVVGPEAPLIAGIAGRFRKEGLLVCGPSKAAAMLTEGSKVEFKQLLARHDIPTARFEVFTDRAAARAYVRQLADVRSVVIKADGLMDGKGVTLPATLAEAERDLERLMVPGSPGEQVIIEDRLVGKEISVTAAVDRQYVRMLPYTRDYKREGDGDTGRNTGSMGSHTLALPQDEKTQLARLLRSVVAALAEEKCSYTGFMYLGVMMTTRGPEILECNCRLGDTEAEVILSSIDGSFPRLCLATARGDLEGIPAPRQLKHALCVTLASEEYPDPSDRDGPIYVPPDDARTRYLHGRTARREDGVITTNRAGRPIVVVGLGQTLMEAHTFAYAGVKNVRFSGMKYRRDIGSSVLRST